MGVRTHNDAKQLLLAAVPRLKPAQPVGEGQGKPAPERQQPERETGRKLEQAEPPEQDVEQTACERNGNEPPVLPATRREEEMKQQHQQQRARLLPFHRQEPLEVDPQQVGPLPHGQ